MQLHDLLTIETCNPTDTTATLRFHDRTGGRIADLTGTLRGPRCKFSKTLPSTFTLQGKELLVTEPCYWSPRLPFLYEAELTVNLYDGTQLEFQDRLGINRWETHGRNLRLEGKRAVLRGGSVQDLDPLREREAEVTVYAKTFNAEMLQQASEAGVPNVVDLRGQRADQTNRLAELTWYPAVVFAVLDQVNSPLDAAGMKVAQALTVEATPELVASWANALLIELKPGERPLSWLSNCNKPVLIRQIADSPQNPGDIRKRCDQLQAFLAPKFDCAGYFIG